jgi:hypothetical protein
MLRVVAQPAECNGQHIINLLWPELACVQHQTGGLSAAPPSAQIPAELTVFATAWREYFTAVVCGMLEA